MSKEHLVSAIWLSKSGFIGRLIDGKKVFIELLDEQQLLRLLKVEIVLDDDLVVRDICKVVYQYKELEKIIGYFTNTVEKINNVNHEVILSPVKNNDSKYFLIYNTIIESIIDNKAELTSYVDCTCVTKDKDCMLIRDVTTVSDTPVKLKNEANILQYNFNDPDEIEPRLLLKTNKPISVIDALSSLYYELGFSEKYNENKEN